MKARDSILALLLLLPAVAQAAPKKSPVIARPAAKRPAGTTRTAAPVAAPADPAALVMDARAAAARGETDLALRLAQSAIVADPARASSYDALGDVYAANHQAEYARNYYEEALSIDPADASARKAIAGLDRAGDTRKADASDGAKSPIP